MAITRRSFLQRLGIAGASIPLFELQALAPRSSGRSSLAPSGIVPTPFPFVDGLTFITPGASLSESGLSGIICDVSSIEQTRPAVNGGAVRYVRSFQSCARSMTAMRRTLAAGGVTGAFLATHGADIRRAHSEGGTAVFFQLQGADPIGEDLTRLDLFFELGLRVLQITHHNNNAWGGGALEPTWTGLTKVGADGVDRLNELGIIPDLSHVGDVTALDVLKRSRKPVIISHGAARALVNNARCAPDSVIKGVADSGGVMGVFMMSFWLTTDPIPTTESYLRQLKHIRNVGGVDAAGIANDFDVAGLASAKQPGVDNAKAAADYHEWWNGVAHEGVLGFGTPPSHVVIPELNNIRRAFSIAEALDRARFPSREIEKIMGGNWIRVLSSLG
jgi:membrane dipeptidase